MNANIIAAAFEPIYKLNQLLADRKKVRLLDGSKARFKRCKVAVVLLTSANPKMHVQLNLCHMDCSCKLDETGFTMDADDKPVRGIACWEMSELLDTPGDFATTAAFKSDTEPIHAMLTKAGRTAFDMLRKACHNSNTLVVLPHTPYEVVCRTDYSNTLCAGCTQPFGSGLKPKHCTGCMSNVLYCSKACQRAHYQEHHNSWCEPEQMLLMRSWSEDEVSAVKGACMEWGQSPHNSMLRAWMHAWNKHACAYACAHACRLPSWVA